MGTVHIQHIVQCGGGHPHGEILFPGLLVQVREVGVGLTFIGKGIEVCVGIILGQQEIGQLVALLVHRPQGVVGAVIISQRTAGNDELLALVILSANDRIHVHMGTVPNGSGGVGAQRIDTFEEIALSDKGAVVHGQSGVIAHADGAGTFCFLRKVQGAVVVHQNAVGTGKSVEPQSMSIALHLQIIFALSGNMQFGRTTLTADKRHADSAYRGNLALVADFYIVETCLNTSDSFQFNLALVGNGQFSLSVTLGAVDGSTILSTDASGGVVEGDVGAAFGSNGDTHAIAADIHLGIFEGDVPGIVLIVDATNLAVDVQRAVLYGQAGTGSTVDCRALCSLDLQCAVTFYRDVIGTVNAITIVAVD